MSIDYDKIQKEAPEGATHWLYNYYRVKINGGLEFYTESDGFWHASSYTKSSLNNPECIALVPYSKPPLGVCPSNISKEAFLKENGYYEKRKKELLEAMLRYAEADKIAPRDLVEELFSLLESEK